VPAPPGFEVAADDTYYFRVKRPRAVFRLRLQRNGKPLTDEAYVLIIGERTLRGSSDGDGRIETAIPAGSTGATLVLPERGEQYELSLGHLAPASEWRGAAQRLQNLGLYDGEPSAQQEHLGGALRQFQVLRGLEVTGALDEPTIAALQEAHGC
jgi:hypothetical protein